MLNRSRMGSSVNPEKSDGGQRSARIIRFPLLRRKEHSASDDCQHRWIFLAPGYQLCAKCGAVRKKPSATEDAR